MTPNLGIMASSTTGNLGTFESIATFTSIGGENSLTFSSIPGTYKSLQIRGIAKTSVTLSQDQGLYIVLNSTGGTSYAYQYLVGNGTTAYAGGAVSQGLMALGVLGAPGSAAGQTSMFGASIIDIIDYASTSKCKIVKYVGGSTANAATTSNGINLSSGLWMDTSAITSVRISLSGGASPTLIAGSTFALYGVK